jgi:predicted lipoprotein with Yx(FWY)xxD motif
MRLHFFLAPVALALIAAGCGGGSPSTVSSAKSSSAAATSVGTRHTKLGTVLVDSHGRTLYLFEKDKGTTSRCSGACASVWPPLAGKSTAGRGVSAAKLAVNKRGQLTYAAHPLYTYAGDTRPGDVNGQGLDQFGAEWYVLAPSGRKIDGD